MNNLRLKPSNGKYSLIFSLLIGLGTKNEHFEISSLSPQFFIVQIMG
jgi:hypothetical protein